MRRDSVGPGACFYFHTISSLQPDCNTITIPLQTNKSNNGYHSNTFFIRIA